MQETTMLPFKGEFICYQTLNSYLEILLFRDFTLFSEEWLLDIFHSADKNVRILGRDKSI